MIGAGHIAYMRPLFLCLVLEPDAHTAGGQERTVHVKWRKARTEGSL